MSFDREAVSAVRLALWEIQDKTGDAPILPADYYELVDSKAAGQRVSDDLGTGRLQMRWAADLAEWGLEDCCSAALAQMDLETAYAAGDPVRIDRETATYNHHLAQARECLDAARDLHLLALEAVISSRDRARLSKSSKKRGRVASPEIAERNRRLAEGVDRKLTADPTLLLKTALVGAVASDPDLAEAFASASHSAVEAAYADGKKNRHS